MDREQLPPSLEARPRGRALQVTWLLIGVAALALRLWVMSCTIGTNDMEAWRGFAVYIQEHGLVATYHAVAEFNHPPLMGEWARLALAVSGGSSGVASFPFVFKLLPFAGDVLSAWLLFSYARERQTIARALALSAIFLCNPCSLLITAYHGNTDPLLAALCLWAALAAGRGRMLAAGLALGAALNVKLIPSVLVVPLAFAAASRKDLGRYVGGLLVMSIPFVWALLAVKGPFLTHVLAYNSVPGMWGINLLITDLEAIRHLGAGLGAWREPFFASARYLILGGSACLALLAKPRTQQSTIAVCAFGLCLSLVLAAGFGYQYLAWPLPLLFAREPRRAFVISLAGGVLLALLYLHYWDGVAPALSRMSVWPRAGVTAGFVTWALLLSSTWRIARSAART
jgi:hypothetical protein